MSLPGETANRKAIARWLAVELAQCKQLLQFGVELPDPAVLNRHRLGDDTMVAVMGLFTKACISYRAIILLGESGLDLSAAPVNRSLFETFLEPEFLASSQGVPVYIRFRRHDHEKTVRPVREEVGCSLPHRPLLGLFVVAGRKNGEAVGEDARTETHWKRCQPSAVLASVGICRCPGEVVGKAAEGLDYLRRADHRELRVKFGEKLLHAVSFCLRGRFAACSPERRAQLR